MIPGPCHLISVSVCAVPPLSCQFFFFNDPPTTEIYTLSLHDALPICGRLVRCFQPQRTRAGDPGVDDRCRHLGDRKSTRLNSSHANISYAVFCLKKKKIRTS